MLKRSIKQHRIALLVSLVTLILYYFPFYKFVISKTDIKTLHGSLLLISLIVLAIVLNAFVFYVGLYLLRNVGKWILILFFNSNAIAVYFINTYGIIIDRSMIGNIFNTRIEESSSFFSFTLVLYLIFLGIIPSILLYRYTIIYDKLKRFLVVTFLTLIFLLSLAYVNSTNWLWIDKNSKSLGALSMPWSYVVNTIRFYSHKSKVNKKQILLPDAKIKNNDKEVMVLVIGESARRANFQLYGYKKPTNPLLSKMNDVYHFEAESCGTYTTAGVKCILEYKDTGKLYEILPNYLYRNGVDVIWRTTNWGEPTVKIGDNYLERSDLKKLIKNKDRARYDEVLLAGLKEQILASKKNKILIVLHTSTSHGPTYNKRYPKEFERYTPVCESVELAECSHEELINAYDNTIVYTDYLLANLIKDLKQLSDYKSAMIFISDHGESLGEKNLYMHGLPLSIAPEQQYDIPFIVWISKDSKKIKNEDILSQHYIFHSVLNFLDIDSPIYDEKMNVFE